MNEFPYLELVIANIDQSIEQEELTTGSISEVISSNFKIIGLREARLFVTQQIDALRSQASNGPAPEDMNESVAKGYER